MTEPKWLPPEDVADLQAIAIEKDGGLAGGLTRPDLLESALSRPQNEFAYTGQDNVFMLAAIYAEGIARNHAFADANKRTGFLAAAKFLLDNGVELQTAKGTEHADMMVSFTEGKVSREVAAEHLQAHSRTLERSSPKAQDAIKKMAREAVEKNKAESEKKQEILEQLKIKDGALKSQKQHEKDGGRER